MLIFFLSLTVSKLEWIWHVRCADSARSLDIYPPTQAYPSSLIMQRENFLNHFISLEKKKERFTLKWRHARRNKLKMIMRGRKCGDEAPLVLWCSFKAMIKSKPRNKSSDGVSYWGTATPILSIKDAVCILHKFFKKARQIIEHLTWFPNTLSSHIKLYINDNIS